MSSPSSLPPTNSTPAVPSVSVIEEQLHVGKQVVETGKINLTKRVHEEQVKVDVPLLHEEFSIERVAINQPIAMAPPAVRYEGDVMIVPVLREELVVQKQLVLVEELRLTKRQVETHSPQNVTLRQEEVLVSRDNLTDNTPPTPTP